MKSTDKGLTLSKYVTPGSKIELESVERVRMDDGTYKKKKYESKVLDIIDDETLEILMPMEQAKLVLLPVDGEYDVRFFCAKGLFQCFVRVVERYKSSNIYLVKIQLISNLQKYQRREYYRYSTNMAINIRELSSGEKLNLEHKHSFAYEDLPTIEGTVLDISGGGVRFMAKEPHEMMNNIVVSFSLVFNGKNREYTCVSQVLSCRELENRRGMYEHRVKYVNITNGEREEIIRYIFEEERTKRRREI